MRKKAAFITVHGMGRTEADYNEEIVRDIRHRLGASSEALHVGKVYYQDILQPNEDRVWEAAAHRVEWDELRKFLLFGFADAAGLESNKDDDRSGYRQAQVAIARELLAAREAMAGDGPVLILAQSLGCQVVSCYFWDAMRAAAGRPPTCGIWRDIAAAAPDITGGPPLAPEDILFLQGSHFRTFMTTGCNIPVFVAAHAREAILPIKPNAGFEWHNYYDKDDVLGWPLSTLSEEYREVVVDHPVNANGGILGWLLKSWNPMSHSQYWSDDDVLDPLEQNLRALMS